MRIPARQSIIDRANDERADAVHAHDESTVRQLDTLIGNLHKGAKLRWAADGALMTTSCNTKGNIYRTTQHTCDCPAFKPCWHMRMFDLLLDMLQTEAETADQACDPPGEDSPLGPNEGDTLPKYRPLGPRLAAARSAYAYH
jgi:hypothetical protein